MQGGIPGGAENIAVDLQQLPVASLQGEDTSHDLYTRWRFAASRTSSAAMMEAMEAIEAGDAWVKIYG
jgi:hypothetical protein